VLVINATMQIPESELQWSFVRAGGPGGQNVNKVASKAVLRWNLAANRGLPADVKGRFAHQQRGRITSAGELIIQSQRFRDQERNRQDCIEKLLEWLRQAAIPPKKRRPTRPTRGSRESRLQEKRRRSGTKRTRQRPDQE
jgi:ribosome-associated protein